MSSKNWSPWPLQTTSPTSGTAVAVCPKRGAGAGPLGRTSCHSLVVRLNAHRSLAGPSAVRPPNRYATSSITVQVWSSRAAGPAVAWASWVHAVTAAGVGEPAGVGTTVLDGAALGVAGPGVEGAGVEGWAPIVWVGACELVGVGVPVPHAATTAQVRLAISPGFMTGV